MALKSILKTHRTWEDGVGLLLGLTVGLSPWFRDEGHVPSVVTNAAIVGLALLLLAQLELIRARRWEEMSELACGVWLCFSPSVFGYGRVGSLRYWHWVLGGVVVVLALFELWQSRGDSNDVAR